MNTIEIEHGQETELHNKKWCSKLKVLEKCIMWSVNSYSKISSQEGFGIRWGFRGHGASAIDTEPV